VDPTEFATIVDPNEVFLPDKNELEKLRIESPFEDALTKIEVNT